MIALELVGWKRDVKVVSLVEAVRAYSSNYRGLRDAHDAIDDLIGGRVIFLEFDNEKARDEFRVIAEELGAVLSEQLGQVQRSKIFPSTSSN